MGRKMENPILEMLILRCQLEIQVKMWRKAVACLEFREDLAGVRNFVYILGAFS